MLTQMLVIPSEHIPGAAAWLQNHAAPKAAAGLMLKSRAIAIDCQSSALADRLAVTLENRPGWRRSADLWLGVEAIDPTIDHEAELEFAHVSIAGHGHCEVVDAWIVEVGFSSEAEKLAFHDAASADEFAVR